MCREWLRNSQLRVQEDLPEVPDPPTEADLNPWRERIDEIDRVVLQLINERVRAANVIGCIKHRLGLPVYVPDREQEVVANVTAANNGPLTAEAVRRIFERLIDETRSIERQKYQEIPPL